MVGKDEEPQADDGQAVPGDIYHHAGGDSHLRYLALGAARFWYKPAGRGGYRDDGCLGYFQRVTLHPDIQYIEKADTSGFAIYGGHSR